MLIKDSKYRKKFQSQLNKEFLAKEVEMQKTNYSKETYGVKTVGYSPTDGRPIVESADPSNHLRSDRYRK